MKFTQPCFVRVEDAKKRNELVEWLVEIGWRPCASARFCKKPIIYADHLGFITVEEWNEAPSSQYDCGTNTELFKALTAMNDENDREQWFKERNDRGLWKLCNEDKWATYRVKNEIMDFILYGYRKATAEEIIEHFKKRKINESE